jgi:hypothetical protein
MVKSRPAQIPVKRMPVDPQIPESTPYALIGGKAAVRNLVNRFCDLMDEDPNFTVFARYTR